MRGCGERKDKALYLECATSPDGLPIEHFIFDPPIPINQEPFRAPILWRDERTGIYHVLIWIGKKFYESPWDFIKKQQLKGSVEEYRKTFLSTNFLPVLKCYLFIQMLYSKTGKNW